MKYLKLFESLENIHEICKKYNIEYYTINSDGSIDVDGNVNLNNIELKRLPLNFRNVSGYFSCSYNDLTNLVGSPTYVGSNFGCAYNNLTSLEAAPNQVGGFFYCRYNNLTSLVGSPTHVGGDFHCTNNILTKLEGVTPNIVGDFYCNYNRITSLEGFPTNLGGDFYCPYSPVYEIWKLFKDKSKVELFNDYDIIRGSDIVLDRLNDFLITIGKDPVEFVEGYNNI